MSGNIIKIYQLQNTPCKNDYNGCGRGCLVVKNGIPQLLLYAPDREAGFSQSQIKIDEKNIGEITKSTEVYLGMASCWEFCCERQIFPVDNTI
mgnify:CR=1 FL=1